MPFAQRAFILNSERANINWTMHISGGQGYGRNRRKPAIHCRWCQLLGGFGG